MSTSHCRPEGEKKAYVRLAPDYDALDVANKVSDCYQQSGVNIIFKNPLCVGKGKKHAPSCFYYELLVDRFIEENEGMCPAIFKHV